MRASLGLVNQASLEVRTFAQTLEQLWIDKYTGAAIVHFQSGRPLAVDFPQAPKTIRLDSATKDAQSYEATVESR